MYRHLLISRSYTTNHQTQKRHRDVFFLLLRGIEHWWRFFFLSLYIHLPTINTHSFTFSFRIANSPLVLQPSFFSSFQSLSTIDLQISFIVRLGIAEKFEKRNAIRQFYWQKTFFIVITNYFSIIDHRQKSTKNFFSM